MKTVVEGLVGESVVSADLDFYGYLSPFLIPIKKFMLRSVQDRLFVVVVVSLLCTTNLRYLQVLLVVTFLAVSVLAAAVARLGLLQA